VPAAATAGAMAPAVAVVSQATTTSLSSARTTADAVNAGLPAISGVADSTCGSSSHALHHSSAVEQPAELRSTAWNFPASLQPAAQPIRSDVPGMNGP